MSGWANASDEPVWRIANDVIAGSVTVTVHDGGEEVLHDGRRLYAAETMTMTAFDGDPARASLDADVVYRWHEHAFSTEIRARSSQTSDAEASTSASTSRSTSTASRSSRRGARRSRDGWSDSVNVVSSTARPAISPMTRRASTESTRRNGSGSIACSTMRPPIRV